ncbi:AAA family ATPase [Streptomyces sp. NPDC017056]|uniref:AAA family ATPase n=1 Tax=Streptomyces sp. NPDC017056 TaxID=3364973 RepID=UPI003795E409
MTVRLALIGAYGNGKTTLADALSAELGLPKAHANPMRDPQGSKGTSLEQSSDEELFQLTIRRFGERLLGEAAQGTFVSDGSVLHEWIYLRTRLAHGLHPAQEAQWPEGPATAPHRYAALEEQIGHVVQSFCRNRYDGAVLVPAEFPLTVSPPPISERFRGLIDELSAETVKRLPVPSITVSGSVAERVQSVRDFLSHLR